MRRIFVEFSEREQCDFLQSLYQRENESIRYCVAGVGDKEDDYLNDLHSFQFRRLAFSEIKIQFSNIKVFIF